MAKTKYYQEIYPKCPKCKSDVQMVAASSDDIVAWGCKNPSCNYVWHENYNPKYRTMEVKP